MLDRMATGPPSRAFLTFSIMSADKPNCIGAGAREKLATFPPPRRIQLFVFKSAPHPLFLSREGLVGSFTTGATYN